MVNNSFETTVLEKIDEIYNDVDVYIKESIKDVAKAAIAASLDDTEIANAITDYIRNTYSDNGNIIFAHCFKVIPKASLHIKRNEVIKALKQIKDDPPYDDVTIVSSCGDSVLLNYINEPDEPVTIICDVFGGDDPEGRGVDISLTVSPSDTSSVNKIAERRFEITFSKAGTYNLLAISQEKSGKKQFSQSSSTITVHPAVNNPPSNIDVTLSCGSSLQLGTGSAAQQTITATITGGIDPEGKTVTKTVECSTAKSVKKVNDTTWNVTLDSTGIHVIIATATDPTGLKSVKTAMVKVEGQSSSTGSTSGQFSDAKFDSGWSDYISGCYVSGVTFSLTVSSNHSSSSDYLVILGKKSDGTIVILRDKFSSGNRFKTITEGTEVGNSVYARGNLKNDTHKWTNDPYTLENEIRQVRFICETPGHESCAKQAKISFEMSYTYDSSLN